MKKNLYPAGGVILFLLAWELLSRTWGSYLIPSPGLVFSGAAALLKEPESWQAMGITIFRVFAGFLAAFTCGSIVGMSMGRSPKIRGLLSPFITFFQGIPPLLWIIPLLLITGNGGITPILGIAFICFPPVVILLTEGMESVPGDLLEMLTLYAPGRRARLKEVILPHLRPFLLSALKSGVLQGIKASVVCEYFGANEGIGFQIQTAYQALQIRKLFAWGALLFFLIFLFTAIPRFGEWLRKKLPGEKYPVPDLPPAIHGKKEFGPLFFREVSFSYTAPLLEKINLTLAPGKIAILSGESGKGKTTLLKLAAGLLPPREGNIEAPGPLSLQFQEERLLPWRTTLYNTALPLLYRGLPREEAFRQGALFLKAAGLGDYLSYYPGQLSGGMKKRAAFARLFTNAPGAILLDEPFTGLDPRARKELLGLFINLWKQNPCPALLVTHYPEEMKDLKEGEFFVLKKGTVLPVENGINHFHDVYCN